MTPMAYSTHYNLIWNHMVLNWCIPQEFSCRLNCALFSSIFSCLWKLFFQGLFISKLWQSKPHSFACVPTSVIYSRFITKLSPLAMITQWSITIIFHSVRWIFRKKDTRHTAQYHSPCTRAHPITSYAIWVGPQASKDFHFLPTFYFPPPQSFPPQISVPPGFNSGTHFRQPSPIPQSFNLPSMDLNVHLCFCQIIVPIFPLGIVHNSSLVRMRQNSVAMLPQRPNTPTSTFLTAIPWVSFWTIVVTVPVLHWAKREISWPTVQLVVDCLKSLSALLVLKVGLTARYWSKPLKTKFHTEKAFLSLSIVPT